MRSSPASGQLRYSEFDAFDSPFGSSSFGSGIAASESSSSFVRANIRVSPGQCSRAELDVRLGRGRDLRILGQEVVERDDGIDDVLACEPAGTIRSQAGLVEALLVPARVLAVGLGAAAEKMMFGVLRCGSAPKSSPAS